MMNVLIVESNRGSDLSLASGLKQQGFDVFIIELADGILQLTRALHPCSVIIDVQMIDETALGLCRLLRENGHSAPIMFLSDDHVFTKRVEALQAGAQDFIAKPCLAEEVVARLKTHICYKSIQAETHDYTSIGKLILNYRTRRVHFGSVHISLTQREADLTSVLMRHANSPVSRYDLYEQLWKHPDRGNSNVVDVYVGYLRTKFTDITRAGGPMITTVRGIGFMLDMGGNPALRV